MLNDTIRKNIAFGEEDHEIRIDDLNRAISQSQLTQLVASMPAGVDTMIGEDGSDISGGEKQRIGLARALYKAPKILILDEATSSLDKQTEDEVLKTVFSLKGPCTIIMVSHSPETLKNCDQIISLSNGVITTSATSMH